MFSIVQGAVQDGPRQVFVMQDSTPLLESFVGGKQHGSTFLVALVHYLEQNIGCVRPVAQIAHLITDQHLGGDVVLQRPVGVAVGAQVVDERRSGGKPSLVAILDSFIGNGNTQMRLSSLMEMPF